MAINLLPYALGLGFIAIVYFMVDKYYLQKKAQTLGRRIRILLMEQVGNDKIYRGEYEAFEVFDDVLGVYINIGKIKKAINVVNNDDYFPDVKFGKCLWVCKYAEDDFRSISIMRRGEWFQKVALEPGQYLETEEVQDPNNEEQTITQLKINEEGEPTPLLDEKGEPVPDYNLVPYEEPIGVEEGYREAMRFNRAYAKRMAEKRKTEPGFWEKYGQMIATISVVGVMFMCVVFTVNKNNEFLTEINKENIAAFRETAGEFTGAMNEPAFGEKVLNNWLNYRNEKDAPDK